MIISYRLHEALHDDLQTANFLKAFGGQPKIKSGASFILEFDGVGLDPGSITLRMMLKPGQGYQRYVIGLRFSQFGKIASIDLVSHPFTPYNDTIVTYYQQLGMTPSDIFYDRRKKYLVKLAISPDFRPNQWSFSDPVIFGGGFYKIINGKFVFVPENEVIPNDIFGVNTSDLAAEIYRIINLKDDNEGGQVPTVDNPAFLQLKKWIVLLDEFQGHDDFYERFVDSCPNTTVTNRQLLALHFMKVNDRVLYRDDDPIQASTEELTTGLSAYLRKKITDQLTKNKNDRDAILLKQNNCQTILK